MTTNFTVKFNTAQRKRLAGLLAGMSLLSVLSACAVNKPLSEQAGGKAGDCQAYFQRFDELASRHQARDHQAAPIAGFPYLRIDRLLASLAPPLDDELKFAAWIRHQRDLDQNARGFEYANLPAAAQSELQHGLPLGDTVAEALARCGALLSTARLKRIEQRQALAVAAVVPDSYRTAQRVLGLYPLSALVVRASVSHWQRSVRARFTAAAERTAARGEWRTYVPPEPPNFSSSEVANILLSARDPLGLPVLDDTQLAALFARHAPVWEVDTLDDNDRPGRLFWGTKTAPDIDTSQVPVYTHVSYTHFGGRLLLQLNYTLWFAARPPDGPFDILAGTLDGLHWRVTLDSDGDVLLYDSMHPCGCYHQFFPGAALRPKNERRVYQEPILVPQNAPSLVGTQRLRIRVSAGSHYILQLLADEGTGAGIPYHFAAYDSLRSLPLAQGGRRSLFADGGLVPGTERGERWLLWPMGIASPGAMRQWGNHATAFVGRRHFDDPHLIERNFSAAPPSN